MQPKPVEPSGSPRNPDPHGWVGDRYELDFGGRRLSQPLLFPGGPPFVKRTIEPGI